MLTTCPMKGCIQTGHLVLNGRCLPNNRAHHKVQGMEQDVLQPNLEASKPVIQVNEVSYSNVTWQYKPDHSSNGQPHPAWFHNNFRENNKQPRGPFRKSPGWQAYKHGPKKIVCYYCEGEHLIKYCVKLAKEKSKEQQKDTEVARQYKSKL